MYEAQQQGGATEAAPEAAGEAKKPGDEEVVDAEFEVKD